MSKNQANQRFIEIKNAKVHNLKSISLKIPHNKLVVITGLSGSGKSSLAFHTLYAEGQRRYVESLSSYARQFLGKLDKPEVDYIKGISPAIAIQQQTLSSNPRSTVGTVTEIYDYLKVLFARVGKTFDPETGDEVKKHQVTDVVDQINKFKDGTKFLILAPWRIAKGVNNKKSIENLLSQGFTRVYVNDELYELTDSPKIPYQENNSYVVIDRLIHRSDDEDYQSRIADSVQTSFYEGFGDSFICTLDDHKYYYFNNRFENNGITFIEPTTNFFTFNNPYGACQTCEGFGSLIGIDPNLVIPDKNKSIYDGAIAPWKGEKMSEWLDNLIEHAAKYKIPIHKPYAQLSNQEIEIIWRGNKHIWGIDHFFKFLQDNAYKIQYRIMQSRYRGKTLCVDCRGTRLRKETNNVKIDKYCLSDFLLLPIKELKVVFENLKLDKYQKEIAKRLLIEINNRLHFLNEVGLGYLTLNRQSGSLSGGESQRINLATSLGSSLVGSMYILDEPSIGLHPRDTTKLIAILKRLKDIGNTVIVVEHEEEVMMAADEIIDMGPQAGLFGGEIVFQGIHKNLIKAASLTAKYLTHRLAIPLPEKRRKLTNKIKIVGARENNLKNITVEIPLNGLVCITGVSGSGKSTLVKQILYPALCKSLNKSSLKIGEHDSLGGDIKRISDVEMIDQNPIGRSSRSNPATYVKAFDFIRDIYANQQLSKMRGYKSGHFSYNVPGGRCEVCKGDGFITISMQFMADVQLTCEECKGKRYTPDTLEVEYKNKNINDVLNMSIDDALIFFEGKNNLDKKIIDRIKPLADLGLGYLKLGQASSTLSGGEAQRIKLASFLTLGQKNIAPTLFIFDEPTTGLHFHDIDKLVIGFNELIKLGHSIVVIEHNMDVIKTADWLIDIGPEGGNEGGHVVFEGTPEDLIKDKNSYTAKYLKEKLVTKKKVEVE